MRKNLFKIIYMSALVLILTPSFCRAGLLSETGKSAITSQTDPLKTGAGFGDTVSIGSIITAVIMGFLALLGIIFIILIILAGWKYMNARGDEQKTQEAIDQIRHAVIGLIIIIGAYAITYFVFNVLPWGGTGGGLPG
jgi:hypothetical protein